MIIVFPKLYFYTNQPGMNDNIGACLTENNMTVYIFMYENETYFAVFVSKIMTKIVH